MSMTENLAIQTDSLGYRYRRNWAVRQLNLKAPEGKVYGLLGLNGAGKSTTIRMLMGLIRRREGTATVLGLDPQRDPVGVKAAVGYVPETHSFYDWMQIDELIGFVARYRSGWDDGLSKQLLKRFDLNPMQRIGELSKGQRAKVGLLLAMAFRPRLLILDEPTSGLDPSARREFLEGVLAGFQEEGGTIFISSHLINEISGIVDYVGVIHEGKMHLEMPLEELRDSVKRIRLTFAKAAPGNLACPGLLNARIDGREAAVSVRDFKENEEQVRKVLQAYEPEQLIVEDLNLEDIFIELVGRREGSNS
jgi:ABC-2 type transport system ATP-binding protein